MAAQGTISPHATPRLPLGVRLSFNQKHGGWLLLAPERVFKADSIASRRDRQALDRRGYAARHWDLARVFETPRERIESTW
jgi:pyrroloquinoline quinone biosynthesis protein D